MKVKGGSVNFSHFPRRNRLHGRFIHWSEKKTGGRYGKRASAAVGNAAAPGENVGERLRRMGLLTETGSIETSALTALAHTFAGLLFDDLCDASQDYSGVQTELQQLFDAVDRAEPRQKFLLLCLQYDRLSQVLPDPIWWISGTPEIAGEFAGHFIRHLKKLSGCEEVVR